MAEEKEKADINPHFVNLVISLEASAMQSLGKIISPVTGKSERNLMLAQATIDMLNMLEQKTAGNLTNDENNLLKKVLYQLRINYVDEKEAEKKEGKDAAKPSSAANQDEKPENPEKAE